MSINQNANAGALPNFRNLGILLRILVIVDGISLAAALLETSEPLPLMEALVEMSAQVQPILLASLLTLAAVAVRGEAERTARLAAVRARRSRDFSTMRSSRPGAQGPGWP